MSEYDGKIVTNTGVWISPENPSVDDINIFDIAHALSNTCRYGGHCDFFYSVAEHSIIVSRLCSKVFALEGLLHDASEAYFPDIPSPIKRLMPEIKNAENNILNAIWNKFGLSYQFMHKIKAIDSSLIKKEVKILIKRANADCFVSDDFYDFEIKISGYSPLEAKKKFLERFFEIKS
jgi:uncharacterized protein